MMAFIGLLAGILAGISYIPYARDILRHRVKPERASWLIWVVLAGIAFFSQLAKGATQSLWLTGLDSLGALTVLLLSLHFGVGGLKRRDVAALIIAAVGLLLWHFTHNALYALLISMGIDAAGTILTVWKTFEDPASETYTMWLLVSIASILALISVGRYNLTLMSYPLYIFMANISVVCAIFVGRHMKRSARS